MLPLVAVVVAPAAAVRVNYAGSSTAPAITRRDVCAGAVLTGGVLSYAALPVHAPEAATQMTSAARAAAVFCHGPLLDAVQRAGIFGDCKVFVDSPLKAEPEEVLRRFALLPTGATRQQLLAFVRANFDRPGTDLVPWAPTDYVEEPPGLAELADPDLRAWALSLNRFWSQLGRATSAEAAELPHRRTLLALPNPFVVPGGRFVETYYWGARTSFPIAASTHARVPSFPS